MTLAHRAQRRVKPGCSGFPDPYPADYLFARS
jgi:hypothetical protein